MSEDPTASHGTPERSPGAPAHEPAATPAPAPPYQQTPGQKAAEERKVALANHIASAVATQNARIESQSDFQAVLLTGQKVNHLLHFLVGVFTCGVWWIIWLVLAVTGGEKRHLVQVDEYGNVRVQHL